MLNATEFTTSGTSHGFQARFRNINATWVAQGALAALFIFAGVFKLVASGDQLAQSGLPVAFIRFIGVCETLGGLGLVLPGIANIKRGLTPVAAFGLVIIMVGAVTVTIAQGDGIAAGLPLAVGIVAAHIAVARRSWLPN